MRPTLLLPGLALLLVPGVAIAQSAERSRVENALSAAPASVAKGAMVMDLDGTMLREGSNGWVCMPDNPEVPNNSPM